VDASRIIAVIPARYQSTRFVGKPLADIGGKSMIQRVYEQAKKVASLAEVIIATDDSRIEKHAKSLGARVVMTGEQANGTGRCYEAIQKSREKADFILNIQGDEPFILPDQIDLLCKHLSHSTKIATMAKRITDSNVLFDPNVVKVTFNKLQRALYFSRSMIPFSRNTQKEICTEKTFFYKHIGVYAYQYDVLAQLVSLSATPLECTESLEQLRWLEHGFDIQIVTTLFESIGIDTPDDINKVLHLI